MFPNYDDSSILQVVEKEVTLQSDVVKNSFSFDFDKNKFVLFDGKIIENSDIEATKQWIITFLKTMINGALIYEGKQFGTSIKKLRGSKRINNGYLESEIEREIKEGFLLCPSIERVSSFNLAKDGSVIVITVGVVLKTGERLEESVSG